METTNTMSISQLGTDKILAAFAKAQSEFQPIERRSTAQVGTRHYKYADLAAVLAAVRPALTANGLAITQSVEGQEVVTRLIHSSGQSLCGRCPLVMDEGRRGPQALGSALTYSRRYGLSALLGVASEEDDDGQAAQGNQRGAKPTCDASNKPSTRKPPPTTGKEDWQKKAATEKQLKMLWTLWRESGYTEDDMKKVLKGYNVESTKHLTGGEVSKLIDDLKSARKK